jgi:uncharacterized protein YoaH (UPF0181 family)
MRLMNELKPGDKTICNFRTDNAEAIKKAFREFSMVCRELGLYGGEEEAADGAKFRANNPRKNNHNKTAAEKELTRIEKRISEYLAALEQGDKEGQGEGVPSAQAIKAALEELRERKAKYEGLKGRVEKEGEASTVDPDAKLMRSGGGARQLDVCYNVQTAVDGKHHLIVDFDIAERSDDKGNLFTMSEKAKEILGVEKITNLADKGYYDGEGIAAWGAAGVTCLAAKPKPGGAKKEEGFTRGDFEYDRGHDSYTCPCKKTMGYMRNQKHGGGKVYRIYANYAACGKCPEKEKCTQGEYRQILRPLYQDTVGIVDGRARNNKTLYRKRQEIAGHPFGTIKAVWGYKQFLCRTKEKVRAEVSLAYLAYNLRRVINIFTEKKENPAAILRQRA